jgi:hypothetical protein
MKVKVDVSQTGRPPGKLADAELLFDESDGPLNGLKLVGFGVWQRHGAADRQVTFPARRYTLSGAQRSYALLRPVADGSGRTAAEERLRTLILQACAEREGRAA